MDEREAVRQLAHMAGAGIRVTIEGRGWAWRVTGKRDGLRLYKCHAVLEDAIGALYAALVGADELDALAPVVSDPPPPPPPPVDGMMDGVRLTH